MSSLDGPTTRRELTLGGATATCAVEIPRQQAFDGLRAELARWLAPGTPKSALDALVLARLTTHHVRWVGVHHLDEAIEADLAALRDQHRGGDTMLDSFLDCVLAKHDKAFWNRTYLCLPVLEKLIDDPETALRPNTLAALLSADVVRYELCAARRGKPIAPLDRPDSRTLRTRVRHAIRFLSASLGAEDATTLLAEVAHDPEAAIPDILAHLPSAPARHLTEWIEVTVQPVSIVHDEYFFIRALQSHELTYGLAAQRIAEATAALRTGDTDTAVACLDESAVLVARGASLFRMIATMRREAFHAFRDFTQGASAIQSEQYKRFEARCGMPPEHRFASPAFDSVPAVKGEMADGFDSLSDAWLAAETARPHDPGVARVAASMTVLETAHRRWKRAHLTVATRMLGTARGTGYTAGVPYLQAWGDHRLFWNVPSIAATASTAP